MKIINVKLFAIPLIVIALLILSSFTSVHAATSSSGNCLSAQQFSLIGIQWGSTTSEIQVGPGSKDVPLTITLLNNNLGCTIQFANVSLGNPIENVPAVFSIISTQSGKSVYVSDLGPGASAQVTFYLNIADNATIGNYSLPIKIEYSNSTISYNEYIDTNVSVLGIPDIVISTKNDVITSGQINNVSVTFTNTGTGNASSISTTVSSSETIFQQVSEIASLPAGASVTKYFEVDVPSSSGSSASTFSFSLSYTDPDEQTATQTQSLDFLVQSDIAIELTSSSILPTTPNAGSPFSITVTLTNAGLGTADNVEAVPSVPSGLTNLGDGAISIGDLSSGSSTSFTLTLITNDSLKTGTYVIPINVSYLNSLQQVVGDEVNIPVKISQSGAQNATSSSESTGNNNTSSATYLDELIIIVIAVAEAASAAVIAFLFLRYKRSSKKSNK